ncbi:hypothetical protein D6853_08290 [Butyrivibrio sp. X503]|uniref:hypothetical protein n=1 Tax=Butyrivibrio sp. X503 TaxID=2364878 RepID=UPI000EA966CE|nr:hypothetical protein [Butyrivibrio sp. X503]RKM55547.1 hypothetical protein D6853_08290 [Butyrivibrio sp. X503]
MSNTTNNKRSVIIISIALILFMLGGVISFVSGYLFAKHEISQAINSDSKATIASASDSSSTSESASDEETENDNAPYESIKIEAEMNKSVSLDWSKDIRKEYLITFEVNECDDTCELSLPAPEACSISYTYNNHRKGFGFLFDDDSENIPDTITGFKTFDVNFDGFTDLLFTGTEGLKEMSWLFVGSASYDDPYDDDEGTVFMVYPPLTDATQYLDKGFTVDDVCDYYSKGQTNGEFSSYQEGYKAIIGYYETLSAGTNRYDLININDDDIPELLMDTGEGGRNFSVCTFKNGYVHQFMDWRHSKSDFEYVPYINIIMENFGPEYHIYSMKDCKLNSGNIEDLSGYKSNPFKTTFTFSGGKPADDFIKENLN